MDDPQEDSIKMLCLPGLWGVSPSMEMAPEKSMGK